MSKETAEWLNRMTLIGHTAKRGTAWHYREELQGDRPNHFPGAIPRERVLELIGWEPLRGEVTATAINEEGVLTVSDPSTVAIMRPAGTLGTDDVGGVLGYTSPKYQEHGYKQWLVENLEMILDGGLSIGSAGMLRAGALAWVQAELEDTVTAGGTGVTFRPFLTAATSLDQSIKTTYQTGAQVVVCDNTLNAAMNERGAARVKIRHSARSLGRIAELRDSLQIVQTVSDEFTAQVEKLCATEFSNRHWNRFLDIFTHRCDIFGEDLELKGAALTKATKLRSEVAALYLHDERVAPWAGTAFGAVQAVNTYYHHLQPAQKGTDRAARNMERMVKGEWAEIDSDVVETVKFLIDSM